MSKLLQQHPGCPPAFLLHVNPAPVGDLVNGFRSVIPNGDQIKVRVVFHFKSLLQLADQDFNPLLRFIKGKGKIERRLLNQVQLLNGTWQTN